MLLAAELKRIPYESKLLELSKGQLKTHDFLAMSPRGKVPVIRDGDSRGTQAFTEHGRERAIQLRAAQLNSAGRPRSRPITRSPTSSS